MVTQDALNKYAHRRRKTAEISDQGRNVLLRGNHDCLERKKMSHSKNWGANRKPLKKLRGSWES